jgi:hypothetical protein
LWSGIPRVVSHQGSFGFVTYDGMEEDEERSAALAAAQIATGSDHVLPLWVRDVWTHEGLPPG